MGDRDTAFAAYFAARSEAIRGTAYLLCGDWHRAEDLVQTAFTKLYLVWNRVSRHEVLDAYVRQILVRTFLDERRRGWWQRERVGDEQTDRPTPPESPETRSPPGRRR
ncbi:sigma factor [Micromonospora sp. NPDC048894]|uniref:sigma factor n=1 Tax=Micromonospora sp. NPDC048894 TaxID=3155493 RepID=UPI0033C0A088